MPRSSAAPRSGRCAPATVSPALIRRSGATRRAPRPQRLRARPMRPPPRSVVPRRRPRASAPGSGSVAAAAAGCGCCGGGARIRLRLGVGLRLGPQAGSPRRVGLGLRLGPQVGLPRRVGLGLRRDACVVRRRLLRRRSRSAEGRTPPVRVRCRHPTRPRPAGPPSTADRRLRQRPTAPRARSRGRAPGRARARASPRRPVNRRPHRRPATPRPGGAAAIGSGSAIGLRLSPRRSVSLRRSARAPPRRRALRPPRRSALASAIGSSTAGGIVQAAPHGSGSGDHGSIRGASVGSASAKRLRLGFGRRHRLRLEGRRLE